MTVLEYRFSVLYPLLHCFDNVGLKNVHNKLKFNRAVLLAVT